jgi:FkbH-like protein
MAYVAGIDIAANVGDFNAYTQEILDEGSALYRFEPDVVVVAALTADVTPDLWERFTDLTPQDVEAEVERVSSSLANLVATFRARSDAHLVVHSLEAVGTPSAGVLDAQSEQGQVAAIRRINDALASAVHATTNAYVLDYDRLVARRGASVWADPRRWATVHMPMRGEELVHLAGEWLRFFHPISGKVCKVLAVDLDNTLWGGVVGEDGVEGLKLDDAVTGVAYRSLQRAILDVHRRGVILAVCSKNNYDDAIEAIDTHPGMLLRRDHFAAFRIDWNDKSENLRAIAQELNVGIDSVAFLDDNPAERTLVRARAPEVTVIELPNDPMEYAAALRAAPVFERLTLTDEDRSRGRLYVEQRRRTELQRDAASLEDFYRSLDMEVEVSDVTPASLPRAAQLTQKTNQFNLTTRRYSEQQLSELLDAGHRIRTVRVRDRFGDNGLVGVVITKQDDGVCEIDSFLLSCRVIGRTIETALLATVADQAEAEGARALHGAFVPTRKNKPAEGFLAAHGFELTAENGDGSTWELVLEGRSLSCPPWIQLEEGG